jgi:putative FmdB family regulatory protein
MPTYEFRCPQGHEFEKFYRTIGGAEAQALCPECGQPAERLMSAAGFAFKGSGFYLTDYGKNAHRDKGAPDARNGAATESGSEAAKGEKGEKGEKGDKGEKGEKSESKADTSSAPAAANEAKPAAEPTKREAKAAEPKPAAAPKKSTGE